MKRGFSPFFWVFRRLFTLLALTPCQSAVGQATSSYPVTRSASSAQLECLPMSKEDKLIKGFFQLRMMSPLAWKILAQKGH